MSIRYKFFGAFSIVVVLAIALAAYGFRAVSTTGDLVVNLYDGPLMGINHARSAHAALNEARLLLQRSLTEGVSKETTTQFEKLLDNIAGDLKIVRERVKNQDLTTALELAESRLRDWSDAALSILKPPRSGLTEVSATYAVVQKSERAVDALDDLVEMVAAYGFDYRMEAEATVAAAHTTMLAIAIGTTLIGLTLAAAIAYSMSKPIFTAMQVAERVAGGNFDNRIDVSRSDELGRLLTSLAGMQDSLKARAVADRVLTASNERLTMLISAMSATNEAIMRAESREELLELVCKTAVLGGKFTTTTIALAEPESDFLHIVSATGPGAEAAKAAKVAISADHPEGRDLTGTAFRTRQPCVSNDYLADRQRGVFGGAVSNAGTKSGAALPLLSRGRTVASFSSCPQSWIPSQPNSSSCWSGSPEMSHSRWSTSIASTNGKKPNNASNIWPRTIV